jgi:alanyl-tRNA synthetase
MQTNDLRRKYIEFFKLRGHAEIGSASLIPENDPTVLFTTAGMHPLVPFLLGEKHPAGRRLVSYQKCIRTGDIEEVGDAFHLTFFEMLGNWSLGDYFKEEAIKWSWEFLTSPHWLGLDSSRISVTCFAGDADAPKDTEAATIWEVCGVPKKRIFFLGKKHNWWGPAGMTGPCGPDTEMFWHTHRPPCGPECSPACTCGHYVEIWNDVFMQYEKLADGSFVSLKQKNVDTGMGLVRTAAALQGLSSAYETELYAPLMKRVARMVPGGVVNDVVPQRVICDHLTAAVMIISDGVEPARTGAGYVARRLIRRAVRMARKLGVEGSVCAEIANGVIDIYAPIYPQVGTSRERIIEVLNVEEKSFADALTRGLKEFERLVAEVQQGKETGGSGAFPMDKAFHLYDTYGFPPELTRELISERGYMWDQAGYDAAVANHQATSRADGGSFKGGLADHSVMTTRLHTATHLLHAALRNVLGTHVEQRGSNITTERLRFDFSHPEKMTPEQVKEVEKEVQRAIDDDLPVSFEEMSLDAARQAGAIGLFGEKYGERVKVYMIGTVSAEICGGPHAKHTGLLGKFKIVKEEASAKGIRRIRATIESPE